MFWKLVLTGVLFAFVTVVFDHLTGFERPKDWRRWTYDIPAFVFGCVVGKLFMK